MKIIEVSCPSCGASLNAREDQSRVICEFCGGTVVVEDSKQEGFNHEMGAIKARASVSDQLANAIDELAKPLIYYKQVAAETETLKQQLQSLEKQLKFCQSGGKLITYISASLLALIFLLILCAARASILVFLFVGIIAAAMFPVIGACVLQYEQNMIDGIDITSKSITAHENTSRKYKEIRDAHKDINIPEKYRTPRAMKFLSDAIRGQKANSVEHAMSQYDDLLMREKSIALQEEQIRLQQQQINETKKLRGDVYGAAVVGGAIARGGRTVIRQRGHSIIIHLLLLSVGIGFITIPYYTLSPKHYWHL